MIGAPRTRTRSRLWVPSLFPSRSIFWGGPRYLQDSESGKHPIDKRNHNFLLAISMQGSNKFLFERAVEYVWPKIWCLAKILCCLQLSMEISNFLSKFVWLGFLLLNMSKILIYKHSCVCFLIFTQERSLRMCMFVRFLGERSQQSTQWFGEFGCFPWSCTNLVIEQLIIPPSKHLSLPVAYFMHHTTTVAGRMQVNQNSILNIRYLHG